MYTNDSPKQYTIHKKIIQGKEASLVAFPETLLPEIQIYLKSVGIQKLYTHQAEMFNTVSAGKNVVITTSTASGKTLAFLLPVLQDIIKNPLTRAIFVYPTKALASDQYRAMRPLIEFFGGNKISIGVYDGDTPVNERRKIRNSANIILTNPEMLNSAFLPHHNNHGFNFIFSNLKYVIIDELHSYRGAFGSHLSNVFRRLSRICKYYASAPQFLCSSATIANPLELAEKICSQPFHLIDNDGSPAPQKQYYLLQPPLIKDTAYRKSVAELSSNLIPELIMEARSIIAFCKSRKAVEVVLKESRDQLKYDGIPGQDFSDLISGYRGGYTPLERKAIENKMITGKLKGLISTNALELGIDIGKVDTTVLTGYPGTRASFWQQSGRAGRSGQSCDTFLILDNLPFDQYLAIEPEWLFQKSSENAVVDKNNLFIQIAHIRAAAAELPLSINDITLFPDLGEIIPVLIRAQELKNENGKFTWCGKEFPAGDYSLRNMDKNRYKLTNSVTSATITEMDETQAFREIHEGAIYMHDGQSYQVLSLNLESRSAIAKPVDDNFYTEPFVVPSLRIIKEHQTTTIGRTQCHFGDVNAETVVQGYKKLQFHNHQNLGFQPLSQALTKSFDTEGIWVDLPTNVVELFNRLIPDKNDTFQKTYSNGLCFALQNATMMTTMTTKEDIHADIIPQIQDEHNSMSICIYDLFVGGLGYSEKAYEVIETIINNAIKMISGCPCKDGCPACVGDYNLNKEIVLWGLKNLYEELPTPNDTKISSIPKQIIIEKPFQFESLAEKWSEFTAYITTKGEYHASFISSIHNVKIDSTRLVLIAKNDFYKSWILEKDNKRNLKNMLSQYVTVPSQFDIDVIVETENRESLLEKLTRRYNDLTNG